MTTMTLRLAFLAIAALTASSRACAAGSYPARMVKVVVPFAAGGPIDVVARNVASRLSADLNQTFLVENRPGAGGNLGTESVVRAAADGYTLAIVLGTTLTVNPSLYPNLPFDPAKDLRPIAILTRSGNMLVVHPSLPVDSLAAFVAFARRAAADNKPLLYGAGGIGTPGHLVMEYFRLTAGFEAKPVAYRGNAPMVADLLAGNVKVGFVATAGVINYVEEGRLRGVAVSTSSRSPLAPGVPTVAEAGYPGFAADTYIVMLAPARTPDTVVAALESNVARVLHAPDLREKLRAIDTEPVGLMGAAAAARIAADRQLWARVVKASHMKVY